jgi:exodeoxyribonuclease VII large subunit
MAGMDLDLFDTPEPPRATPRVYSVSEVTRAVRTVIEEGVGVVWVEGEVSNHRRQSSGHQYFTLKDANSQLPCVLFARPGMWRKDVPLSDGMHVQVRGAMTVYEARGQYQMNVQLVQAGGAGLLQAKFEALKCKLEAEGLFDPARKRALPAFPRTLGVVTSPTGAALRDMLNVLARRAPWLRVIVSPARVQGDGAAQEVAAAIEALTCFEEYGLEPVDVIVIARGGGSVEDLWAFNEEVVARAIAASAIPVVSAVGHEIDFTIADFVADLRAPTPSAAAELVAPDTADLLQRLAQMEKQMARLLAGEIERSRARLMVAMSGALFREPPSRLDAAWQQLDLTVEALQRSMSDRLAEERRRLADLLANLREHRPDQKLALLRQRFEITRTRIADRMAQALAQERQRLERAADLLRLLAPESALKRGFSMTTRADGTVISSAKAVLPGTEIVTRFHDGTVRSTVNASDAN